MLIIWHVFCKKFEKGFQKCKSIFWVFRDLLLKTLDQRFLFTSKDQREGLSALLYFAVTKKGVAIVCGDCGTGKSMLINSFLDRLPESIQPIIHAEPVCYFLSILIHIAKVLRIRITRNDSVLEIYR